VLVKAKSTPGRAGFQMEKAASQAGKGGFTVETAAFTS
jgi:hypothetical protein